MKLILGLILFSTTISVQAQNWKVLPKGVRIVGYRNVTTSKISQNFNSSGQESSLGASFRVDANTFNSMTGNLIAPNLDPDAYSALTVGAYKVDAEAQLNVQGTGFGYGITDKLMYFAQFTYYTARVNAGIKRTAGNTYNDAARILADNTDPTSQAVSENLGNMIDAKASTIQSVITNYYNYKPIGDWQGSGFGDMETGVMAKVIDKGVWGLMFYPGVVLPTGRQDDPDILQDIGFGDGQFDLFGELASGYIVNDRLSFGANFRYTYQAPTSKTLRVPNERDFQLSNQKGQFDVKYGDRANFSVNSTYAFNDWFAITPYYRMMYQGSSQYDSKYTMANKYLAYNSDKIEHQAQLTATFSSITPFLKKEFLLPAQVNVNVVKTVAGRNIPAVNRFEVEFRMLF